jgi:CyaY protein
MNESEFEALAGAALERIERALESVADASGVDLDFELKEGGILEIEFDDGSKIIVNRHGAAREIWVAARSGGFHFRWDGAAWRDTREGTELFAALSKLVSQQGGQSVILKG